MVCGFRSAAALAESGLSAISSLDTRGVADSNLLLVVTACVAAIGGAVLLPRVMPGRRSALSAIAPQTRDVAPAPALHSELIDELLRTARIAHREGIPALSHPLNRSSDPDVQYAIDLVCSRADARIVRGVLIARAEEHTPEPATTGRLMRVSILSTLALVTVCGLWIAGWVSDRIILGQAAGLLFGAWCVACALWCFGSAARRRSDAPADPHAAARHDLILAAAEGIVRGDSPDSIEHAIRGHPAIGPRPSLAEAA